MTEREKMVLKVWGHVTFAIAQLPDHLQKVVWASALKDCAPWEDKDVVTYLKRRNHCDDGE